MDNSEFKHDYKAFSAQGVLLEFFFGGVCVRVQCAEIMKYHHDFVRGQREQNG